MYVLHWLLPHCLPASSNSPQSQRRLWFPSFGQAPSHLLCAANSLKEIFILCVLTSSPHFLSSAGRSLLGLPPLTAQRMRYPRENNLMAKRNDFCPPLCPGWQQCSRAQGDLPLLGTCHQPGLCLLTLQISSFLHPQPHLFLRSFRPLSAAGQSPFPFRRVVTRYTHSLGWL